MGQMPSMTGLPQWLGSPDELPIRHLMAWVLPELRDYPNVDLAAALAGDVPKGWPAVVRWPGTCWKSATIPNVELQSRVVPGSFRGVASRLGTNTAPLG